MREFEQLPDGVKLENKHVQQLIAALMGLAGDGTDAQLAGVPIRATAVDDDTLFALDARNRAADGNHIRATHSSGSPVLFSVTDDGVFVSIAGAAATQPFVMPGMIVAWHGAVVDIPVGWALCDGTNGTPDLRDRFIIGAGSTYALDATGGAATVDLSHTHDIDHNHAEALTFDADIGDADSFETGDDISGTTNVYALEPHVHRFNMPALGTTASGSGGSATQSVLNPYYGIFYIKRVSA